MATAAKTAGAKTSGAKTVSAPFDQAGFLDRIADPVRRAEADRLLAIFAEVTGYPPRLWGGSMVGFGRYAYRYDSGHSGESLATGFAPRKAEVSVYILPGYAAFGDILARLGPHRIGKACLYLKRLDRVDEGALRDLIRAGLDSLATQWPVLAE
ncbi:MAG: DUF1801 domain-containing protein [Rhodobacterales bacterium]|nr:MAG: DUF1801 domain-containing protein [Rhodobacterales bacterium]